MNNTQITGCVAGDFNTGDIDWETNCVTQGSQHTTLCNQLLSVLSENGLDQVHREATREDRILDLFVPTNLALWNQAIVSLVYLTTMLSSRIFALKLKWIRNPPGKSLYGPKHIGMKYIKGRLSSKIHSSKTFPITLRAITSNSVTLLNPLLGNVYQQNYYLLVVTSHGSMLPWEECVRKIVDFSAWPRDQTSGCTGTDTERTKKTPWRL